MALLETANEHPVSVSPVEGGLEWNDPYTGARCSVLIERIVTVLPTTARDEGKLLYIDRESAQNEEDTLKCLEASGLPSFIQHKYSFSRPVHLERDATIHVVVSTHSGTRKAKPFFSNVLKPLLSFLDIKDYLVHETTSAETILELATAVFLPKSRQGVPQTIVLLSGDGGLIDLIKAFSEIPDGATFTLPVVSLIPMGTGNASANSAGLLSDSTSGLTTLLRGCPRILPTFQARLSPGSVYITDEGRGREAILGRDPAAPAVYGAVVVSWGMHASLVADSDTAEYRKFGADRFKMAAKELLYPPDGSETHRYKGTVTVVKKDAATGQETEHAIDRTEHMYVLTTLVSQLESGFKVSPASKPLDKQLRIVHFGPLAPDEAMGLMSLAYQGGRHVKEAAVGYEAVEAVRIRFDEEDERWRRICIDGTIAATPRGGQLEILASTRDFVRLVAAVDDPERKDEIPT